MGGDGVYIVTTVKLYGPVRKAKTVVNYPVFILLCKHMMVIPGQPAPNYPLQPENGLDAVSPQTNKDTIVHISQPLLTISESNILFFSPFFGDKNQVFISAVFFLQFLHIF